MKVVSNGGTRQRARSKHRAGRARATNKRSGRHCAADSEGDSNENGDRERLGASLAARCRVGREHRSSVVGVGAAEEDHLKGYEIKDLDQVPPPANPYAVTNQFGSESCELKKPQFFLVQSEKNTGDDRVVVRGEFVCYKAKCWGHCREPHRPSQPVRPPLPRTQEGEADLSPGRPPPPLARPPRVGSAGSSADSFRIATQPALR